MEIDKKLTIVAIAIVFGATHAPQSILSLTENVLNSLQQPLRLSEGNYTRPVFKFYLVPVERT